MAARPTKKLSEYDYLYGDPDGDDWQIMRYDPVSEHCGIVASAAQRRSTEDLRRDVEAAEKALANAATPEAPALLKRLVRDYGGTHAVIGGVSVTIPLSENWLAATALDPGLVAASLDVQVENAIAEARAQAALGVRLLLNGGDLADNRGPIYGPKVFREIYLPRLARLTDELHKLGCWCLFTSDGNLWTVADMMFDDCGVDCYGEVDWTAGMDLARLKARYPRVTYWGNVPTSLIQNGTRAEVLEAAHYCIESVGDKRLILGSSNAILPGSPPENVYALGEAVERWGA
jgi:uroporphyrinogen decarboxylase